MDKKLLIELYFKNKLSMAEIADKLEVSQHKTAYWMEKYGLKRRPRSEAAYVKQNPDGDPFTLSSNRKGFLKGLGLGLYWGEGTKANKYSVRISNSDPALIKTFLEFLRKIYQIDDKKLKFGLHIFSDIDPKKAIKYWSQKLKISPEKFLKPQVISLKRKGTYKKKSKYGVVTLIFQNKKLRDIIVKEVSKIKSSCS